MAYRSQVMQSTDMGLCMHIEINKIKLYVCQVSDSYLVNKQAIAVRHFHDFDS